MVAVCVFSVAPSWGVSFCGAEWTFPSGEIVEKSILPLETIHTNPLPIPRLKSKLVVFNPVPRFRVGLLPSRHRVVPRLVGLKGCGEVGMALMVGGRGVVVVDCAYGSDGRQGGGIAVQLGNHRPGELVQGDRPRGIGIPKIEVHRRRDICGEDFVGVVAVGTFARDKILKSRKNLDLVAG